MKNSYNKGSVATLLISVALLLTFFIFVPTPHYHHKTGWTSGPSVGGRIMGTTNEGAPLEEVLTNYINSTVQSPFNISCKSDLDCNVINIENQCKTYCADGAENNDEVIESLQKNRVCDPAFWKPETQNCRCVFQKCLNIKY